MSLLSPLLIFLSLSTPRPEYLHNYFFKKKLFYFFVGYFILWKSRRGSSSICTKISKTQFKFSTAYNTKSSCTDN
ncbi:MAG: hypothetical protein EWV53_02975 [Microcystis panniformis Mp_MB_F_20051200_S9]|uniref:Uncharacterized protein n=1 Tax=Microcystis panniformis Mp_MB_F_20051200_S9 TaxID=2486223 RepID=A0A552Q937_9CHRO|nr:MAG: hypothetical protein EWV43_22050 [Microcystis panniformis Mp_MB_F_20080800_S26D]TRV47761.1 MAG: hypothetical protein EWV42_15785 [Microcystis panniformis Mp_GB_SS_20050300_S99D]TRV49090.1 MAG: hypothetical protein EWV87_10940 [Microcystis panniformis Mp_GB_SS_20050300_S99]TRV62815.1 MAG: hypothetical protein EWV69_04830 [Microcystis panniformis Mp_MB_F_20080800_S26]TRV65067.1 MAG: hypothetical protein EWV86_09725 [Microcystis panniformis Mp_MB_F_20051200_S9D]TRV65728.1 MAG: hypothetica